jgi:DNA-binding NarL/FixJ family response regulator
VTENNDINLQHVNPLRVVVYDPDYYAMNMIARSLAWDRRTHVRQACESLAELHAYLEDLPDLEYPEALVMTGDKQDEATIVTAIQGLHRMMPDTRIICLVRTATYAFIQQMVNAGSSAVLLKHEVGLSLSWAIVLAQAYPLVTMPGILHICGSHLINHHSTRRACIIERRVYPELTGRLYQAMLMAVVYGLPVPVVAREMTVSTHTVRSYIKEGYRILEAANDASLFPYLHPQERALMLLTALDVREGF